MIDPDDDPRVRPIGTAASFGLLLLAFVPACGILDPGDCTSELRIGITPAAAAISVGEAFTARATLSTCGGREEIAEVVEWAATDTSIITVNSATGRVLGRRAGSARVRGVGGTVGQIADIPVTVR